MSHDGVRTVIKYTDVLVLVELYQSHVGLMRYRSAIILFRVIHSCNSYVLRMIHEIIIIIIHIVTVCGLNVIANRTDAEI